MSSDQISSTTSIRTRQASKAFFIPEGSIIISMLSAALITALELPSSIIVEGAGTTPPTGYLSCDGSAISRITYSTLFGIIGILWGSGDGSTTFNVPDLRGLFTRMIDGSADRDPDKSGRTASDFATVVGPVIGSYQEDAVISHVHAEGLFLAGGDRARGGANGTQPISGDSNINNAPSNVTISSETRPRNVYVNKFIKY